MSKDLLGLDIGSSSLKVVELKRDKKGYHLTNFGLTSLPKETILNGILQNRSALVDTLKNLISNLNPKGKRVSFQVSGNPVIIKNINLPRMSKRELADSIQFEAEPYIPFSLEEVNLDFHILGPHETNPEEIQILLAAAKKAMVNEYVAAVEEAGLKPEILDVDFFALANMCEINYPMDKVAVLVDIGADISLICVIERGNLVFTRNLLRGGSNVTEEIQKNLGLEFEEAEALKIGGEIERIEDILRKTSLSLAMEIQRSLELSSGPQEIEKLFLSGGVTKTPGLKDILEEKVGIPVEFVDPFKNIAYDKKIFDPEYMKEISPLASVAIGLALRKIGD